MKTIYKRTILVPKHLWISSPFPVTNKALIIEKSTIISTVDKNSLLNISKENTKIIYLQGIILPGFVDCHVHLGLRKNMRNVSLAKAVLNNLKSLGIVALRDAGDKNNFTLNLYNKDKNIRPDIIPAGKAITFTNCYGSFLGQTVTNINEGVQLINDLSDQGAKVIKLILSGLMNFQKGGYAEGPYLNYEQIKKLTQVAHKKGLKVMAHANSEAAINEAVLGKVDSIEHGYFISDNTLKLLKNTGVSWIPTLIPVYNLYVTEKNQKVKENIRRILERQKCYLKKAFDLGVLIGTGTDGGASNVSLESSLSKEMQLYLDIGLKRDDVLKAACFNGHKILDLKNDIKISNLIYISEYSNGILTEKVTPLEDLIPL